VDGSEKRRIPPGGAAGSSAVGEGPETAAGGTDDHAALREHARGGRYARQSVARVCRGSGSARREDRLVPVTDAARVQGDRSRGRQGRVKKRASRRVDKRIQESVGASRNYRMRWSVKDTPGVDPGRRWPDIQPGQKSAYAAVRQLVPTLGIGRR